MATLNYRDPGTGQWVAVPAVVGPAGPAGPAGPTGVVAISTVAGNAAVLGSDGQLFVPAGGLDSATASSLYVDIVGDAMTGELEVPDQVAVQPTDVRTAAARGYVDQVVTVSDVDPSGVPVRDGLAWFVTEAVIVPPPTAPPTSVTGTRVDSTTNTVEWVDSVDLTVTGYEVYFNLTGAPVTEADTLLGTVLPGVSTITHTKDAAAQDADFVYYGVRAINLGGASEFAQVEIVGVQVSATVISVPDTTPGAGSTITITALTTGNVGSIQFTKNGVAFGTPTTIGINGVAIAQDVVVLGETNTWIADYSGSDAFTPSTSAPLSVTGAQNTTTTSVTTSGTLKEGVVLTLMANVNASGAPERTTGTVQFSVSSPRGAAANIGGPISHDGTDFSVTWTAGQPYCGPGVVFTATYSGDVNNTASTGSTTKTISELTVTTIYEWWPANASCTRGQFPEIKYYVKTTDGRPAVPGNVKTHLEAMGGNGTMYYPLDANGYGVSNAFAVNSWDPTGPTRFVAYYQGGAGYEDSNAAIAWTIT